MNILPMPDGARAKAHYHHGIETIAYLLEGNCAAYYGDKLEHRVRVRARDQVYIPADVPYAPCNESGAPCTGSWCIPPAAIRTGSYFCPTSMRFLQRDSGHAAPACHGRLSTNLIDPSWELESSTIPHAHALTAILPGNDLDAGEAFYRRSAADRTITACCPMVAA